MVFLTVQPPNKFKQRKELMKNKFYINRNLIAGLVILALFIAVFTVIFTPMKAQEKKSVFERYKNADAVTEIVRDNTNDFVRININNNDDREKVAQIGTIVEDYGSFVILAKDKSKNLDNSAFDAQKLETSINLPSGKFEPLHEDAEISGKSLDRIDNSGKDYYIVQFAASTKGEWLESLEEIGAEIIQYVPNQAYFVYADSSAISKISNHSRVRWVGRYSSEQKKSPHLLNFVSKAKGNYAEYDVAVFSRANLLEIRNEIANTINRQVSAVEKTPYNFFNIIRVEMSSEDIENVAKLKDVVRIDPYVKPEKEDERAAQIVGGNYTSTTVLNPPGYNPLSQFGVDGSGVTVAVVDDGVSIPGNGGFYITSGNTVDGPLRGATTGASGGHGHINASIIAGDTPFGGLDPTGYNYGMGVAPKANIINIPFLKSGNTTTDAQSVDDTLNTLGPNGFRGTITNNSWGSGTNGNTYDSRAALWDGLVQDASSAATFDPINIVFSAGNSGTSGLTRPKMAKNIIAVGNSENIRTELAGTAADNIDDMRSTSSRGPAADGRIKPDITAPGTFIAGSRAGTGGSVSGQIDANHSYSSGTSHAAPQVAAAAALFTQFWKNTNGGNYPSPALIKAAVINTGQEMNGFGSANPIPNGDEGWGRINLKYMFNTGVPVKYINQTTEFSDPGNSTTISGFVADSTKPTRVTLVWTDPPGVSDPSLVNNLDLTVTIGNSVYKGNVFSGGRSVTGGNANTVDNVENVFLPAGIPAGTAFTIQVSATALNGNGILGNADNTDQHFSLVAYNFQEMSLAPVSVSGRVTLSNGRAISRASVILTDNQGASRVVSTNQFGYFHFANVDVGQSYQIQVSTKGYEFTAQQITVNQEVTNIIFIPN